MARIDITPEEAEQITQLGANPTQLAECVWQSEQSLFTVGVPTAGFFGTIEGEKEMLALPNKPGQYGLRKDKASTLYFQVADSSDKLESWVALATTKA